MLKLAIKDLKKSGISADEAEYASMFSIKDASKIYSEFKATPALVIPYIDPWTDDEMMFKRENKEVPFCRVRYYGRNIDPKSFAKKKLIRYGQPSRSGVHPYFPVVEDIDWLEIFSDIETPIMITEGEKKALSACLCGIPTIGLGGVYNFTHDGELLPILDRIEWSRRTIYICYDSDAAQNNQIQVAEGRLATELSTKRNANVFLVRLPEMPGGAKMGVDDFIVKEGNEALFTLLEKAPQMRKIDREVLRMNGEAAWIEKEGLVLDLRTDNWLKKSDFIKGSDFSTRKIIVPAQKGSGVKSISIADCWLTHPHARRYADTIFRPGTLDKAIPLERGGVAYNRFRGLNPEEGDVKPFFLLYDWIMSRTDEFDPDLVWKILAYKVQNLEARIDLALMFLGSQGSGKSLLCKIIAEMVSPYHQSLSSSELGDTFNGWVETSLFVIINEAKSNKLKDNISRLYTYITERRQGMNEKYRPNRQVNSYAFYLFNSNEKSAGAFSDDDRRMIIIGCPDNHPDGDKFYDRIGKWYTNGGPKKLLNFFLEYDLEGWEPPNHAPQTREKRAAYYDSLTPVQKIGDAMKNYSENLIVSWMKQALDWAVSDQVVANPYQTSLAEQIKTTMVHIQVRPFYTPEELTMILPSVAGTLSLGKVSSATPANVLSQELRQQGIDYLKCTDNYDGFKYKGQVRQFLVISNQDIFKEPITQKKFNELMDTFLTYREYKAEQRRKFKRKRRR